MRSIRLFVFLIALCTLSVQALKEPPKDLQIGIKKRVPSEQCTKRSRDGDLLSMHYTGTLFGTDTKFDSSLDRNQPLEFTLGTGRVIKGWDLGLKNMCIGEKRRLTIPPHLGYGDQGAGGVIPGGATLVFDVELVDIKEGQHEFDFTEKATGFDPSQYIDFKSPLFITSIVVVLTLFAVAYSVSGTQDKSKTEKKDTPKEKSSEKEDASKEDAPKK
ncbi:Peptidyl-prolyl cis-trans isomerase fpr2 [Apophysomyces ossiformis]|uniref:peptidylprolyl isomerase n=1 Tax=Apophysomyces ossiformis TaxID=679940 RepID=A0A8H7ERZ8_9FUNG|nr:Peptidyl-prolyl cis-trans isomerase fpr2 [Apophysomyces ossiformis]